MGAAELRETDGPVEVVTSSVTTGCSSAAGADKQLVLSPAPGPRRRRRAAEHISLVELGNYVETTKPVEPMGLRPVDHNFLRARWFGSTKP